MGGKWEQTGKGIFLYCSSIVPPPPVSLVPPPLLPISTISPQFSWFPIFLGERCGEP